MAMKGDGHYNENSLVQKSFLDEVLVSFRECVELIDFAAINSMNTTNAPFCIADYGCAQGKNSIQPIEVIIREMRKRIKLEKPVQVFHVDLPSNDFFSLFTCVQGDNGYINRINGNDPKNIFSFAAGISFLEKVFPDNSIHFGFCSSATHWISRDLPGCKYHFIFNSQDIPQDENILQQIRIIGAEDWKRFLEARASELDLGGVFLHVAIVSIGEITGMDEMAKVIERALTDQLMEGVISEEEYRNFHSTVYFRSREELHENIPSTLKLVKESVIITKNPYYSIITEKNDIHMFSIKMMEWIKSIAHVTLVSWLKANHSSEREREAISSDFYSRIVEDIKKNYLLWNFEAYNIFQAFLKQ